MTTAQENLDIAKSSIAEIRQKVMSPYETRIDLSLLAFFTRGWTEKGGGGGVTMRLGGSVEHPKMFPLRSAVGSDDVM